MMNETQIRKLRANWREQARDASAKHDYVKWEQIMDWIFVADTILEEMGEHIPYASALGDKSHA
jgi:hypothetical protein